MFKIGFWLVAFGFGLIAIGLAILSDDIAIGIAFGSGIFAGLAIGSNND